MTALCRPNSATPGSRNPTSMPSTAVRSATTGSSSRATSAIWRMCMSATLEARLALLEEGGDAFAMVGRLATAEMRHGLAVEHGAEVGRQRQVHVLLHVPVADQRAVRDALRDPPHLAREGVVREDPVHEPEAGRFVGRDQFGQEEELLCLGRPDPPREL